MKNKIYLITKNKTKLAASRSVFEKYKINLSSTVEEFEEIQADTCLEIARHTAIAAAKKLKKPVIREDHGLVIDELGVPGPYMSYIEKQIPPEKLLKIMKNFACRSGYFEIATVYADEKCNLFEHVYKVPITFAKKINKKSAGWDCLIRIGKEKRTLTEYPEIERTNIWSKGFEAVAKFISSN